jgi:hypothetical protein
MAGIIDPYIDPNGYVYLSGVRWASDANGTVGYFKFRYNSGQISIYIDPEWSNAFSYDGSSCSSVPFSTETLLFGQPEPNDYNEGYLFLQNESLDGNAMAMSSEPNDMNEPAEQLINRSFGISAKKLSRSNIETLYPKVKDSNSIFHLNASEEKILFSKNELTMSIKQENLVYPLSDQTTEMISIPSTITGEFVLEPGNIYHATTDVTVQSGGALRHMPGAIVKWAANTGLYVLSGGNYIARGTPTAMCINTADTYQPSAGYWAGIQIQGGSAYVSQSEITYTYISYADIGIFLTDITLNRACENNFVEYCNQGILTYGIRHTRISNNILYWNWVGIEAHHESIAGGESAESVIEISNNTCYENDYGIDVHGSSASFVGVTMIQTNISAASTYYNYFLESGTQGANFNLMISDNGRWLKYSGSQNTDFPAYLEDNPVEVFSNPFVQGSGYFDLVRLNQSCNFINAASVFASEFSQVGFTTNIDNTPDSNMLDLGFHYSNWDYSSNVLEFDFNDDSVVDMKDLKEIVNNWLQPYNFQTFASFAKEWKKTGNNYPFVSVSFSDGQYGGNTVTVSGYDNSDIYRMFLFIDGYYVNEIFGESGQSSSTTEIFAPWLEAGYHEAKIIAFTSQGEVLCYPVQELTIDEGIANCTVPSFFKQGNPVPFSVSSPLSDVRVTAICNGEEVWNSTYSAGEYISGEVPYTITQDYDLECLQFTPTGSGGMMMASSSGSVTAPMSAEDEYDGYTALIICPDILIYNADCLHGLIKENLERNGYKVKVMSYFAYHWRIKGYARNEYIQVLCFIGHGGYDIGVIKELGDSYLRSTVEFGLTGGYVISDKVSNYPPGSAPSWLKPLPAAVEKTIKTWKEMDFLDLRLVTFDACWNGHLRINSSGQLVENTNNDWRGDMTEAFNLYYDDSFFFSWFDKWNSGCTSEFSKFSRNIWRKMGEGYSLQYGLNYAIVQAHSEYFDGKTRDPRYEYRLFGQGYPDWFYLDEY